MHVGDEADAQPVECARQTDDGSRPLEQLNADGARTPRRSRRVRRRAPTPVASSPLQRSSPRQSQDSVDIERCRHVSAAPAHAPKPPQAGGIVMPRERPRRSALARAAPRLHRRPRRRRWRPARSPPTSASTRPRRACTPGRCSPIIGLARLQRYGHRPIALVGGGTGLIGDPSGKSQERNLLTIEQTAENAEGIRRQLERFLDFSPALSNAARGPQQRRLAAARSASSTSCATSASTSPSTT